MSHKLLSKSRFSYVSWNAGLTGVVPDQILHFARDRLVCHAPDRELPDSPIPCASNKPFCRMCNVSGPKSQDYGTLSPKT